MMFIMRGTSCSGKDTFISQNFYPNVVVSSDALRLMLTDDAGNQRCNQAMFNILNQIIEQRIANRVHHTVYNATNLKIKDTSSVIELCKKYKCPYTFLSIVPPSMEELIARNETRYSKGGIFVPEDVLGRHFTSYESCKKPFIDEAMNNPNCSFIEIDQNYEVVQSVGC